VFDRIVDQEASDLEQVAGSRPYRHYHAFRMKNSLHFESDNRAEDVHDQRNRARLNRQCVRVSCGILDSRVADSGGTRRVN
jgi:hypothetical protein